LSRFNQLVKPASLTRCSIDSQVAGELGLLQGRGKPVTLDSSMFESRHISRHFEKRQRQSERDKRRNMHKTREKPPMTEDARASSAACPNYRWRWQAVAFDTRRPRHHGAGSINHSFNHCCRKPGGGQTSRSPWPMQATIQSRIIVSRGRMGVRS